MSKIQLTQVSLAMLQAGNLTATIADFWMRWYGVREEEAWGAINEALDQLFV